MPDSKEPNSIENLDELTLETIEKKRTDLNELIVNLSKTYDLALNEAGTLVSDKKIIERQKTNIEGMEAQIKNYKAQLVAVEFKLSLPGQNKIFDTLCDYVKADDVDTRAKSYKQALNLLDSMESSAKEFGLGRVLTKIGYQRTRLEELFEMKKAK